MVDGIDARTQPLEVRRRLGVLPDARGLYRRLTARENIEYFAALHGLSRPSARPRIEALLETLGMQRLRRAARRGLLAGRAVKTALARALVHDPQQRAAR